MLKMAVLLSGSGRTLDNFHERSRNGSMAGEIQVVIANVSSALGLVKAERYGYPAFHAADGHAVNRILANYDIDIICLAGLSETLHAAGPPCPFGDQYPSLVDPLLLRARLLWQPGAQGGEGERLHDQRLHGAFCRRKL